MVTVVIPNYNGNGYLRQCLDSIYIQTYKDVEVIVVDNASIDGSYEWVRKYKNITYIQLERNYGFSYAVNKGIKSAKGEYILLLNNDTQLCKGFLTEIVQVIQSDTKIFSVSSKMIQYYEPQLIDDAGDEYTVIGWAYKRGDGKNINEFMKQERIFSACAGAALYRRDIFDKIGYFDERFFAYMEDIDICYRANIYGYKNLYAPKAEVYHIGSATSGGRFSEFKIRLSARNSIYVPYKNMPFLQFIINVPCLIMGMFIKQKVFERKGYGNAYKLGLIEGIKSIKSIDKIPFEIKNLRHYIYIEWLLIKNTFNYFMSKLV